ncbi:Abi family protein [Enterococcus faecium]|uniref:Abi family protein n=2 Tax=Enterococcus TaxID=1350 RepID=UPI00223AD921|nr:Abi family protein [Enterococcus faecium]MCS8592456.1 Abi family protein [Enterococcus faecium]
MIFINNDELVNLKIQLEKEERAKQVSEIIPEELHILCKKAENKEIFSIEEQIDYARFKGIEISKSDEDDVRDILLNRTYYFKVTAYRKNFEKDINGKYKDLSFIKLADLAKIDMYLRMILSRMIFELEHSLKTLLISSITNSLTEDGYTIVEEYDSYMQKEYINRQRKNGDNRLEKEILYEYTQASKKILDKVKGKHGYDFDFYHHHYDRLSIWALLEVMTLGNLERFINFYFKKEYFAYRGLKTANQLLKYVTNVRNAAAHSRPLIYNIVEPFQYGRSGNELKNRRPVIQLTQFATKAGVEADLSTKALTNMKMNDIVATLYLHEKYVKTQKLKTKNSEELKELLKRMKVHAHMYEKNYELVEMYHFFEKIVLEYGKLNA